MIINLTSNDVLEILAAHFGLRTQDVSSPVEGRSVLVRDELYWEGNEPLKKEKEE